MPQPLLSVSSDGNQVIIHEHGPLPTLDAALLLSRALAVLLAGHLTKRKSGGIVTL